jgi:hypothetical protein
LELGGVPTDLLRLHGFPSGIVGRKIKWTFCRSVICHKNRSKNERKQNDGDLELFHEVVSSDGNGRPTDDNLTVTLKDHDSIVRE